MEHRYEDAEASDFHNAIIIEEIANLVSERFSAMLAPLFESPASRLSKSHFHNDLTNGLTALIEFLDDQTRETLGDSGLRQILSQFAYGFAHGVCLVAYEPEQVDAVPFLGIDDPGLRDEAPTTASYDDLWEWVSYRTLDIRALPISVHASMEMRETDGDALPDMEELWSSLACGLAEGASFAICVGVSQDGEIRYERPSEQMAFVSFARDKNPAPSTPTARYRREFGLI